MSEHKICPVCKQYRNKLVSLNSINERLHGITISNDGYYIDKICYPCRKKAEKELKKKGSARLLGDRFEILIFGYIKYLSKIKAHLNLSKSIFDEAVDFIKYEFLAWETQIINEEKMRYYFASIKLLLREKEMGGEEGKLNDFLKNHHSNLSEDDTNKAIEEIAVWCHDRGEYRPFNQL